MKYLVTGAAGFIGAKVSEELLKKGHDVVGIDIINDYYDVALKESRLAPLLKDSRFVFKKIDIAHSQDVLDLFAAEKFDRVVHLAAQAGVRYSIENPMAYADSNLVGHLNILEGCRHNNVAHLVYASSSSVYGLNAKTPFSTADTVDHPVSLYAATKKSNELMAHSYSHLYNMPTTGLRFFTVYSLVVVQTWHPIFSPRKFWMAKLLILTIMVICGVISLTLMILLKALFVLQMLSLLVMISGRLKKERQLQVLRRTVFITSVTGAQLI